MLQVMALSAYHKVGIAVIGFIVDDSLHPEESTIVFTNSHIMLEINKGLNLPFMEGAALAMRQLYDVTLAFR